MNAVESFAGSDVESRAARCAPDKPISIYQVHSPSWMRVPEEHNRSLTSSEIAPKLAEHVRRLGFTHVHLHSSSCMNAREAECLVRYLHQEDLGVILENAWLDTDAEGHFADGRTTFFDHAYRWDHTWAAESCAYLSLEPEQRKFHPPPFVHRGNDAFNADCILPLSSDRVSRPGHSLLNMMPGDAWRKFANLRLLFACQFLLQGKKLIFMGSEFGQENPWRPGTSLDWHLLKVSNYHTKLMTWVGKLNQFYREQSALHQTDSRASGFQWIDTSEANSGVLSFLRRDAGGREVLLNVLNFTPTPRYNYRAGAPKGGFWTEVLNSDALEFGGGGQGNLGGVDAAPFGWSFQSHSLMLTLPPLGAVVLKAEARW